MILTWFRRLVGRQSRVSSLVRHLPNQRRRNSLKLFHEPLEDRLAPVIQLGSIGPTGITWADPAPITYGTALGPTQLDATATADVAESSGFVTVTVPGTFSYTLEDGITPADSAVLPVGVDETLNVEFTPNDPSRRRPLSREWCRASTIRQRPVSKG